jgi:threonine/homoserine/homoserine lactone efflux protein
MIISLLIGLIVGFLICIPVGPINVWVVNTLIKHSFKSAFAIALGGALMDFVYFMIILTGLSLVHFSPKTVLVLKIMGVVFLLVFGLKELIFKKQNFSLHHDDEEKGPKTASYFLLGIIIYSSNHLA